MYVVEFSKAKECIHVVALDESLDLNRKAFLNDDESDYVSLYVGTHQQCIDKAKELFKQLHKRRSKWVPLPCT